MNLDQATALVSNYNGGDRFHMYMLYSFESSLESIAALPERS